MKTYGKSVKTNQGVISLRARNNGVTWEVTGTLNEKGIVHTVKNADIEVAAAEIVNKLITMKTYGKFVKTNQGVISLVAKHNGFMWEVTGTLNAKGIMHTIKNADIEVAAKEIVNTLINWD